MSEEEKIDETAKLAAERIMRGDDVSEGELKYMIAGLLLSVNKLTNALQEMNDKMWTKETLEGIIKTQIEMHCKGNMKCSVQDQEDAVETIWAALGRILRKIFRI